MACIEKHLILQHPPPKKKREKTPNKHTNKQKKPQNKANNSKTKTKTLKIRYLCNESVNNTAGKVRMIIIIV